MEVRLGALLASHVLARAPFAELGLAITPTELTFQPRPGRSPVDDFLLVGKAEDGGVHGVSIGARRYPDLVPGHDETVKLLSTFARMGVERWEEIRARRWRLCLATGRQMPALEEVVKLTLAAQAARDDADFREDPRRTSAKDRQRLVQLDRLVDRARALGLLESELATSEITWRMLFGLHVRFLRVQRGEDQDNAEAIRLLTP
ncbi:hypothetical protein PUR61_01500 [Streptomyces sp. BE20]|uniref:hypothetical protein n=1 Tax=Streptomyces sp. BE20 TaxID=3002525 RepID=UPI002E77C033|nr:hypothetical protein [Streptomyces sp. BE20]MEE1820885.1 hypothetical protein [Streptomyces sp. BE20]